MQKKQNLRRICAYASGIAALAAAVAAAWFMPEWFGQWQDEKLLNQVTLETRGDIEFLDGDSIDRAGRLQALERTENLYWQTGGYLAGLAADQVARCAEEVDRWIECGLLPEECADWVNAERLFLLDSVTLYLDDGVFQAELFQFTNSEAKSGYWGSELIILQDSETGMIYYASFSGRAFLEYLAKACGFGSWEEFEAYSGKVNYEIVWEKAEDISGLDFAGPCGGESAQVERIASYAPEDLDDYRGALMATVQFDTFESHAYRREVSTDIGGPGLAVMYGPEQKWIQTIQEILANYGFTMDFGALNVQDTDSSSEIEMK